MKYPGQNGGIIYLLFTVSPANKASVSLSALPTKLQLDG